MKKIPRPTFRKIFHLYSEAFLITATLLLSLSSLADDTRIPVEFEKDERVPLVYLNLVVNGGSVHDPKNKEGLTQLMGEMMLRGTSLRSKSEIDLTLDDLGANLAVETRAEAFIVRGAVLSSELEPFLELIEEITTTPRFDERELKKLKEELNAVLLSEMGRDATIAAKKFTQFLFSDSHPYGAPINGTRTSIANISRDDLIRHHQAFFQRANLSLIALGDASERSLQAFATKLSRRLPGDKVLTQVQTPNPPRGRRVLLIDKPERTQTQILGGQLGVTLDHPDYFPLYLGNFAFGGGSFNSRMMQEIRVKRGWSYGAYSSFRHGREPRSWTFSLAPASQDCISAAKLSLELIDSLKKDGITEAEYQTARESLINSSAFLYNTPQKRAENRILEVTLGLKPGFMELYQKELQNTSLARVNQALNRYLQPDTMTLALLGDSKQLKPQVIQKLGVEAAQITTVAYDKD